MSKSMGLREIFIVGNSFSLEVGPQVERYIERDIERHVKRDVESNYKQRSFKTTKIN